MENSGDITRKLVARLVESGERDRLKQLLQERLVKSGWIEEMKAHAKDVVKVKGLEKITVEELVNEISPIGRAKIPDNIKMELLEKIRLFLEKNTEIGF